MKIKVKVTPHSSKEEVVKLGDEYVVRVTATPHDGKANQAVVDLLAKHFKVPKSSVRILTGGSSRKKVVEIRWAENGIR